jgi:pyrroloquinoline quinone biosynthesis protein D
VTASDAGRVHEKSVPRLARGVRLRRDRVSGKIFLLRPETGFELQGAGSEIMRLCEGNLTVAEIVDQLAAGHREVTRDRIETDVARLLTELAGRGLVLLGDPS